MINFDVRLVRKQHETDDILLRPISLDNGNVSFDEIYDESTMRPYPCPTSFEELTNTKSGVIIKAMPGMGKTEAMLKMIESLPNNARILIISHSRSLCLKFHSDTAKFGFTYYSDMAQ